MSKLITVHYDNKPIYDIVIEQGFSRLAESFNKLSVTGRKLAIITDSNVGSLYADEVKEELGKTGNEVFVYTFPAGEENKNLDTVQDVYEFLIQNRFDRKDMLVALGGGVVGDLTGFAAASYLRGIDFIQIPTSLLAQVDSSIGGKTGVDFRAYKNMVGAFHMPKLVYMNILALNSLSKRLFNSGFGEIIKHGLIKDIDYYNWLKDNVEAINNLDGTVLEEMVARSCEIKRNVVELDPTEKGDRALLNFGHTLGHAIEKLMDFKLYHGECVVLGMVAALNICKDMNYITEAEYDDAIRMFKDYGFELSVTGITADDVVKVSKNDKKMDAGKIKFILLDRMGNAYIDTSLSDEVLKNALNGVINE
ncbi:MAG: 3-dehydroquinate synthase [Lachnospira sp.]|nr:3-dehydroquinate synthase [Lachnospira sp.]